MAEPPDTPAPPPASGIAEPVAKPAIHETAEIARVEPGARGPAEAPQTLEMPEADYSPTGAAFAPNQVLANRYRIVRYLAKGGMGEVYEVEDTALGGRVALKTIRPDISASAKLVERFKREIHLSRKVSHPNVCRIHDLGMFRTSPGAVAGTEDGLFLTMELLSGSTLTRHVATRLRLTPEEALPLAAQMAAGLDAAHAAGVIHRDFKSGNVMLAPASGSGGQIRAVITDFGLARRFDTEGSLTSISDSGQIAGTPSYMAPEQVQGLELTPAADVYAFGIVLYEMLTGQRPFDGGSAMTVAVRRLTQAPAPPSRHAPDLPPAWDAVILRCLERQPAARFGTAGAAVQALRDARPLSSSREVDARGQDVSPSDFSLADATRSAAGRPRTSLSLRLLIPVVLSLAAGFGYFLWRARSPFPAPRPLAAPPEAASPIRSRRSVAVLGLRSASAAPDAAWLSTAISEMLTTDLSVGGRIRTVPGAEVARVKRELGLGEVADLDRETLDRIKRAADTDLVVSGSFAVVGSGDTRLLRLDLRLQDAGTGETLTAGAATGDERQLFDLVSRAGSPLRQSLGLETVSPAQVLEIRASLPADAAAARLYSDGLAKLRLFDALGAREALEKAVASDPGHPLPHAALADAWALLGYDAKASEEAKKAEALADKLPKEQRLALEARRHEIDGDWGKAILAYRSLHSSAPDEADYGIRLADAQTEAGKANEALVTLDTLRRGLPALADDPRLDLSEARAWKALANFAKQGEHASLAAEGAAKRGASLLLARARLLEANALMATGDTKKALSATEEARAIYETAGDRAGLARALVVRAITLNVTGDLDGARRLFQRAAAISREIGDKKTAAAALHDLGNTIFDLGRPAEAQGFYEEALTAFRQIGARSEAAATLNDLGARLQISGDLKAAQKRYQEALTIFGELGERSGVATTLTNLAEVLAIQGDLKQALDMHQEALSICRELGDNAGAAYSLWRIGEIHAIRGDLRVARDRYQEALDLQKQLGDRLAFAQVQVAQAAAAVAQDLAADGERMAREAEEVLRTGEVRDGEAMAQAVLAEALLAQGRVEEGRKISDHAAEVVAKSEDRRVRLAVALVGARVRASSRRPPDLAAATRSAEAALAEASRLGFVKERLEARLVLCEVDALAGRPEGRARLQTLAGDAEAAGFGQVAHRARDRAQAAGS